MSNMEQPPKNTLGSNINPELREKLLSLSQEGDAETAKKKEERRLRILELNSIPLDDRTSEEVGELARLSREEKIEDTNEALNLYKSTDTLSYKQAKLLEMSKDLGYGEDENPADPESRASLNEYNRILSRKGKILRKEESYIEQPSNVSIEENINLGTEDIDDNDDDLNIVKEKFFKRKNKEDENGASFLNKRRRRLSLADLSRQNPEASPVIKEKVLSNEEISTNIERIADLMLNGETLNIEDAPFWNKYESLIDARFQEKLSERIDTFARYQVYNNQPKTSKSVAFLEKYKDRILERAEFFKAEKEKRWDGLSEDQKVDFIVRKIKQGNDVWLPWELQFQQNNGESIEKRLKGEAVKEVKNTPETRKKPVDMDNLFASARRRLHKGIDERFEQIKKDNEKRDVEVNKRLGIEDKKPEPVKIEQSEIEKPKPTPEENKVSKEIQSENVKNILEKMNLVTEDLENHAPNFFSLNENAQIYVLDKLRQKINLDASLDAEESVEKVLNSKTKFLSKDFFKKIKYKWTKEFQQGKAKKENIKKIKDSGLQGYEGDLKALTDHVKESNLSYNYVDGKLVIGYENADTLKNSLEYKKRSGKHFNPEKDIERFNLAATSLSEIPYEWTTPQATFEQKKQYKKLLSEYEKNKKALSVAKYEQIKNNFPEDKVDAMFKLWSDGLDSSIRMNRVMTSHPEISDWEEDPKLRPSFRKATNFLANLSDWSKGSGAVVLGAGARWLTRKSLAYGAGVVAVGAIGGYLGWRKKALEYDSKERKKRYGKDIEDKGIKKYVDVIPAVERLESLVSLLDESEASGDTKKTESVARRIKNHLFVLGQRVESGRVNFGDKDVRLQNMLKMEQAISEANNKLFLLGYYNEDSSSSAELLNRFNRSVKDRLAAKNQLKAKTLSAVKGIAVAAGGYTLGYAIKDALSLIGSPQDVSGRIDELVNNGGNGPQDDVLPGRLPSNPPVVESNNGAALINPPEEEPSVLENPTEVKKPITINPKEDVDGIKNAEETIKPTQTEAEKLLEKLKNNVTEIKTADGQVYRMVVKNKSFIKDVVDFDKDKAKFLVSEATGDIKLSEEEAREFLALRDAKKLYEEGSPQTKWIDGELERLGEVIRSKSGNVFAPYEEMKKVIPSSEDVNLLKDAGEPQDFDLTNSLKDKIPGPLDDRDVILDNDFYEDQNTPKIQQNLAEDNPLNKSEVDPNLSEEFKDNLKILRDKNGNIEDIGVKNPSKVEDIVKFRKNAGNFLVEDLNKTKLPENMQTRSWGIWSLTKSRDEVEKFLALQDAVKNYDENSIEGRWMRKEMVRLGETIRENSGDIFAPYENMKISNPVEALDFSNASDVAGETLSQTEKVPDFDLTVDNKISDAVVNTANNNVLVKPEVESFDLSEQMKDSPVKITTPQERLNNLEINEKVVSKSIENGNLVLDFDSEKINGEITFIQEKGNIVAIEDSNNFRTEEGVAFRKNPTKYISKSDIEKVVSGMNKDGVKVNEKFVLDQFERFINYREVLNESGMPSSGEEAMYVKNEMRKIDNLFDKYTDGSVYERVKLVESGDTIESLQPEKVLGVIDENSKIFKSLVDKYGEAKTDGPVAKFERGFIGFYSESSDQKVAIKLAEKIAKENKTVIDGVITRPVDKIMTQMPDGTYRFFLVYKEAK